MAMKLEWRPEARSNLAAIRSYIRQYNPAAASRISREIADTAKRLKTFPELGRIAEGGAVRLLQVPGRPYLLPYRVSAGQLEILAVFDERQERPKEWL